MRLVLTQSSTPVRGMLHDTLGYVSDLQARTALRIIGYHHTFNDYYPRYNVSLKAWNRYKALSRVERYGEPDLRSGHRCA